ncbi:MAG: DUF5082 family protein [Lachnospiraceae bacterium]|nr:DUF5082 family protein [Lachnospiraceae bacterium]
MSDTSNVAEESKEAELQSARAEKATHESARSSKQTTYNSNLDKISRLKGVKNTLETQKEYAKSKRKSLKNFHESKDNFKDWYGDLYTKIYNNISSTVLPEYDKYIERIDGVLDSVCDEITRLENQNKQLNGDIFRLGSLINSLMNKIETLCN